MYLVTGDREWGLTRMTADGEGIVGRDELRVMVDVLRTVPPGSILIDGRARGADRMAAEQWGLVVHGPKIEVPYFGYLRRRGGPVRNQFMLYVFELLQDAGHHATVLAFHRDIAHSAGTWDMCERADRAGHKVTVYPDDRAFGTYERAPK